MSKQPANIKEIPLDQIVRSPFQPRKVFDQEALQELAQSIESAGLLQPIIVRPLADQQFELIAGERRWRACQLAGKESITALVRSLSDEQAAEAAAIENIARVNLNPIEEARAYQKLIDDFGYLHDEVAAAMGKSRTKITNALRLLKLDDSVQEYIIEGRLSEGHGKVLAGLDHSTQRAFAHKILARGWSVRKIELEVKKYSSELESKSRRKDPNISYLEKRIAEKLGCSTNIQFDEDHGQLKIDFKNLDILEGILKQMGVEEV